MYVICPLEGRLRAAFSRPWSQFFTTQTDPKVGNTLFKFIYIFLSRKTCYNEDRKIKTALRTNQIAVFATVPPWEN